MLRLRTALAALLVTGVGSGAAVATEGIRFAAPAGTYDWSGMYVGGHLGWGWSGVDTEIVEPGLAVAVLGFLGAPTSASHDLDGLLAGGHLGLQHQFDRWVIGLEASLTGSPGGFDGSSSADFAGSINFGGFGIDWDGQSKFDAEINQLFTVTGRIGYAWDRWLAYVKGGYASGEIGVGYNLAGTIATIPFGASASSEERHHGWTLGAGLEHAIMPNVIIGLEYNYIDLQAKTHTAHTEAFIDGISFDFDSRLRVNPDAIHTVYARVSFKLGREAPPPVPLK